MNQSQPNDEAPNGSSRERLLALHRYYIWANRMREHFDTAIEGGLDELKNNPAGLFVNDIGLFLSHWYAALYVVVEGWRELQLSNHEIDQLLCSPHVDLLRRYRNGVCHFQATYFDSRFSEFLAAQGVVSWVRELNLAFGGYFLQRLRAQSNVQGQG